MTARSAGSHGARPGSSGNARSRSACSSASVSGRYGMLALAGYRTAGQHRRPARPRLGGQFAGQPGLADPRLAGEEHHPARAVLGCRERGPQPRGLRIAADEHGTQQVRHQIIMLRGKVGRPQRPSRDSNSSRALAQEALPPGCVRGYVFPPMGIGPPALGRDTVPARRMRGRIRVATDAPGQRASQR